MNKFWLIWIFCLSFLCGSSALFAQADEAPQKAPAKAVTITYPYNVVCLGDNVTLTAHVAPGLTENPTYQWYSLTTTNPTPLPVGTDSFVNVIPGANSQYSVVVFDNGVAVARDTVRLYSTSRPTAIQTTDDTVCPDREAVLSAKGGNYYYWEGFENGILKSWTVDSINVHPSTTTTYHVYASNQQIHVAGYINNCYIEDSATAYVFNDRQIYIDPDTAMNCIDNAVTLTVHNAHNPVWSTGEYGDSINVIVTSDTAVYSVKGTNIYGCQSTVQSVIIPKQIDDTKAWADDTVVCDGGTGMLFASGGSSYLWSNGATTSEVVIRPTASTLYTVKIFASNNRTGCYAKEVVSITVANCNRVYFPSGYSISDKSHTFGPIGVEQDYNSYYFAVFDRYGKRLFESNDMSNGWDGYYQGSPVIPGVYFYIFKIINRNNPWEKVGSVTIVE